MVSDSTISSFIYFDSDNNLNLKLNMLFSDMPKASISQGLNQALPITELHLDPISGSSRKKIPRL